MNRKEAEQSCRLSFCINFSIIFSGRLTAVRMSYPVFFTFRYPFSDGSAAGARVRLRRGIGARTHVLYPSGHRVEVTFILSCRTEISLEAEYSEPFGVCGAVFWSTRWWTLDFEEFKAADSCKHASCLLQDSSDESLPFVRRLISPAAIIAFLSTALWKGSGSLPLPPSVSATLAVLHATDNPGCVRLSCLLRTESHRPTRVV